MIRSLGNKTVLMHLDSFIAPPCFATIFNHYTLSFQDPSFQTWYSGSCFNILSSFNWRCHAKVLSSSATPHILFPFTTDVASSLMIQSFIIIQLHNRSISLTVRSKLRNSTVKSLSALVYLRDVANTTPLLPPPIRNATALFDQLKSVHKGWHKIQEMEGKPMSLNQGINIHS